MVDVVASTAWACSLFVDAGQGLYFAVVAAVGVECLPRCARATYGRSRGLLLRTVCIRPTSLRSPRRWCRRLAALRSRDCAAGRRPPTTPRPLAAIPVPPEVWSSRHVTDPPHTAGNVHFSCSCHELLAKKIGNRRVICRPPAGPFTIGVPSFHRWIARQDQRWAAKSPSLE